MKKSQLILIFSFIILFSSCIWQPPNNQVAKNGLPADTAKPSEKPESVSTKILTDTLPSDVDKINFVITYNPSHSSDYIAAHESGVPVTDKYATDRDVDKGQIYFPCSKKRLHDYKIPKQKIVNIVSIKYNMTVYDKTDYVFTQDTIFEIHTTTANAGIFTDSDIKLIPNVIDLSGKIKYTHQKSKNCNFDDNLFNHVLNFCSKNNIKIK